MSSARIGTRETAVSEKVSETLAGSREAESSVLLRDLRPELNERRRDPIAAGDGRDVETFVDRPTAGFMSYRASID